MLEDLLDSLIALVLISVFWDRGWISRWRRLEPFPETPGILRGAFWIWKIALALFLGFWFAAVFYVLGTHLLGEFSGSDSFVVDGLLFLENFSEPIIKISVILSCLMAVCGVSLLFAFWGMSPNGSWLALGSIFYGVVIGLGTWEWFNGGLIPLISSFGEGWTALLGVFLFLAHATFLRGYYRAFFVSKKDKVLNGRAGNEFTHVLMDVKKVLLRKSK